MAKVKLLDPSDKSRRLDRYELIGELAAGGMATVFLARLAGVGGFQRFVAIKRLHPHLAGEEEFIEMFLDEARLAARIHHPHVVPILEVGQSESGYYLVMEYIEGDTVARIVARSLSIAQPMPRSILLKIMLDALAGLHAAHDLTDDHGNLLNLVHRDCSPQNILVGVDGCSRITDFGVARASSRLSNTRTERLKGKLAYMSPEQANSADVDRRSDVFAMGIILWEVLAGRRLFKGETEAQTLVRVVREPIPRLAGVVPGIHRSLDEVCARALDRDPARRFQSAAEMGDAIEQAAREIAASSPMEVGAASPREVAAYVQGMLGKDIAAQRESVRSWLTHSEPSLPRISASALRAGYDVTVKMPIEQQRAAGLVGGETPMPATRLEIASDSSDAEDGETLFMNRDAQRAATEGRAGTNPPPVAVGSQPPRAPHSGFAGDEGTPIASTEALRPWQPPPSRAPRLLAVVIGVLLVACALLGWIALRPGTTGPAPALATEGSRPTATVAPKAVETAPTAVVAPPPPTAESSAEPTAQPKAGTSKTGRPGPGRPAGTGAAKAPGTAPNKGGEDVVNPYR